MQVTANTSVVTTVAASTTGAKDIDQNADVRHRAERKGWIATPLTRIINESSTKANDRALARQSSAWRHRPLIVSSAASADALPRTRLAGALKLILPCPTADESQRGKPVPPPKPNKVGMSASAPSSPSADGRQGINQSPTPKPRQLGKAGMSASEPVLSRPSADGRQGINQSPTPKPRQLGKAAMPVSEPVPTSPPRTGAMEAGRPASLIIGQTQGDVQSRPPRAPAQAAVNDMGTSIFGSLEEIEALQKSSTSHLVAPTPPRPSREMSSISELVAPTPPRGNAQVETATSTSTRPTPPPPPPQSQKPVLTAQPVHVPSSPGLRDVAPANPRPTHSPALEGLTAEEGQINVPSLSDTAVSSFTDDNPSANPKNAYLAALQTRVGAVIILDEALAGVKKLGSLGTHPLVKGTGGGERMLKLRFRNEMLQATSGRMDMLKSFRDRVLGRVRVLDGSDPLALHKWLDTHPREKVRVHCTVDQIRNACSKVNKQLENAESVVECAEQNLKKAYGAAQRH